MLCEQRDSAIELAPRPEIGDQWVEVCLAINVTIPPFLIAYLICILPSAPAIQVSSQEHLDFLDVFLVGRSKRYARFIVNGSSSRF